MQNLEISLKSISPLFDFYVDFDGKEYIIEIAWNVENSFWTISLYTSEKSTIFEGRKIVLNYNLFEYCSHPLLPTGKLRAVDTSGTYKDCTYDDLGDRVKLVYETL